MKKKLFLTVALLTVLSASVFASTTYYTSYEDEGANPLFNDIYTSLQVTGTFTEAAEASDNTAIYQYGFNYANSVYFMDMPFGGYFSLGGSPYEQEDAWIFDIVAGISLRFDTDTTQETYFNIGPAFSIIAQTEDVLAPYALVYMGVAADAGLRFSAESFPWLTADVGVTAKALWYNAESSDIPVGSTLTTPRDFRYSAQAYVGFTYRWFAPDWSDADVNVIYNL